MTTEQIAKHLEQRLVETCDSWFVVAFTTGGESVVIKNVPTEKDGRALDSILIEVLDTGGVADLIPTPQDDENQDDEF